jgi:type I restriction enzyme M protein
MTLSDSRLTPAASGMFWKAFERLPDKPDAATFAVMMLVLVFVRAQDEADWSEARSSRAPEANKLLRNLPSDISAGVEAALAALRALPAGALAELIDVIEVTVGRLDPALACSLLFDELAKHEGKRRGSLYTPKSVAAILANSIDVDSASTVYDPFCRSGELLVAAARAREETGLAGFSVCGMAVDKQSLSLATMNVQLSGIQGELGIYDTDLVITPCGVRKFSRILSNPPFNLSDWIDRDTGGWRYAPPPASNANYAWLQHVVGWLEPGGRGAVVMANGALSSANPREWNIRMRMVEDGCVEALIALPPALFYGTGIPATIWLLDPPGTPRDNILFVNASDVGHMVGRTHRELSDTQISGIVQLITSWRSGHLVEGDVRAVSISLSRIRERDYNLSPSVYTSALVGDASYETAMSGIRDLVRRLESQHSAAAGRDAIAMRVLKDLTR